MLADVCSRFSHATLHAAMHPTIHTVHNVLENALDSFSPPVALIKKGVIHVGALCIWSLKKTAYSIVKLSSGIVIQSVIHDPLQKSGELLAKVGCKYLLNAECMIFPSHFCDKNIYISIAATRITRPIEEEVLYRGIIQGVFLSLFPQLIERSYFPKKHLLTDQRAVKACRIILTATLFAMHDISNSPNFQDNISACAFYTREQVVNAFLAGLLYSTLRESNLGLLGAIGVHATHDFITISRNRTLCYRHPNPWLRG